MKKDFLLQYKEDIKKITLHLLNHSKKQEIYRTVGMYKNIIDNVLNDITIDIDKCNEKGYLIMHIAELYLSEDHHEHTFFIFNFHTSEVLVMLIPSETNEIHIPVILDSIYNLLDNDFFLLQHTDNLDIAALSQSIKELEKRADIIHLTLSSEFAKMLNNFFNIIPSREMLILFGYYLYAYIYQHAVESKKYKPTINIIYSLKKTSIEEIRAFLSGLYAIITDDDKRCRKNFFSSNDISDLSNSSDSEAVKSKFKDSKNNIIVADASSLKNQNDINTFINKFYHLGKSNHGLIILSKKTIENDSVMNIHFKEFNSDKFISSKPFFNDLYAAITDFSEYVDEQKYKHDWRDISITNSDEKIVSNLKEYKNTIYYNSIFESSECEKYAPIILSLNDFFEFLKKEKYIFNDEYENLIRLSTAIYYTPTEIVTNTYKNHYTRASYLLIKIMNTLYTKHRYLFSYTPGRDEPFIYIRRDRNLVICFNNISDVISFIKNHSDKIDGLSYSRFNDIFINNDRSAEVLNDIKLFMFDNELQAVNNDRKDYKVKKLLYFAMNMTKIEEYINNLNE